MRPIDADKLTEEYKRLLQRFEEMGDDGAVTAVELCRHKAECVAPTLDVAPIIHAHWIDLGTECFNRFECSNCISCNHDAKRYCPNCGAKMNGEKSK